MNDIKSANKWIIVCGVIQLPPVPRRIQIEPHLSVAELEQRYRQARDVIERTRYQIIWWLASGRTAAEAAELGSYSRNRVYILVRKYNQQGPEALGDKRHHNPGQPPLLDEIQQAQLWQVLQEQPPDGDLWDGPKVARWMSELLERPIHPQRGWEYLKALGMSRRRPRPAHSETDVEAQQAWKKTSHLLSEP